MTRTLTWWTPPRADVALAVAALVVNLVMAGMNVQRNDEPLWPWGAALIAVGSLALIARRRHPVIVLAVTMVVSVVYYPSGFPDGPVAFVFVIALYTVAVECRLFVSLAAAMILNAGFVLSNVINGAAGDEDPDMVMGARSVAGLTFWLLLVIALGQYVRNRRDHAAAAERRAVEAERSREQEARRRATEERLRIARELHDVLAHQISLINVQAGAALHRRDDPAKAYDALDAIKQASKDTLRELRGVLGVLRQVDEQDEDAASPVAPTPSLERVEELLAQTTAAGLPVTLVGQVPQGPLPAPVGLAGYRIVQEALTNAVRHAGATAATVQITRDADAVTVQIDDDGGGPADPAALTGGNGLRGIRERAAAIGGQMTAGPGPAGGFRVWARLPLRDPAARIEESAR
ncbi:sensor histidine kinase [Spirillospora sp. NPDC047279]|uniref:sensor histidine kinase n=1 Tax=Spirillospora sp. NPDC047279 TaxID=3155478 RepID=UPI0033D6A1E6